MLSFLLVILGLSFSSAQDFEFIVVGSGAGGGPLACRLARNGRRVLLLEAGTSEAPVVSQVPGMHPQASEDPITAWRFFVQHYSNASRAAQDSKYVPGKGIFYPRGQGVGGSTNVNAMIGVRPQNSDWDAIASLTGDASWSAASMEQHFDSVMSWLHLSMPDPTLAINDPKILGVVVGAVNAYVSGHGGVDLNPADIVKDFQTIDSLLNIDINDAIKKNGPDGMYAFPQTIATNGKRSEVGDYVRATAQAFPNNLEVRANALVTRVLFRNDAGGKQVATGVEYMQGARLYRADYHPSEEPNPTRVVVNCTREVIVAGGAFNTPQLLKLSGIGPREELAQFGIPQLIDLPVGSNLQDRYEIGIVSQSNRRYAVESNCDFVANESDSCFADWLEGRGVYTVNGAVCSILKRSDPSKPVPDLHMFALPG